jgi:hypothetical protein
VPKAYAFTNGHQAAAVLLLVEQSNAAPDARNWHATLLGSLLDGHHN